MKVAMIVSVFAAAACGDAASKPTQLEPSTPVTTIAVHHEQRAQPIYSLATVANKAEFTASFGTSGVVAKIHVEEGEQVKQGQVLATLATANLDAVVEQAKQQLAKATRDLERATKLLDGKAATREQVDDATTGVAVAKAQLRAASYGRSLAAIVAPSDGKILRRVAESNESVAAGQPILMVALASKGWVARAAIADSEIARLRVGDKATLVFDRADEQGSGVVSELGSVASAFGAYEVEIKLDAASFAGHQFRTGQIAEASVFPQTTIPCVMLPASALREGKGDRAKVWVVDGTKVKPVMVRVAFWQDDQAAVVTNLPEGAQVVVDGSAYVNERTAIEVVKAKRSTEEAPVPSGRGQDPMVVPAALPDAAAATNKSSLRSVAPGAAK